mmetsp:Transcript_51969/g.97225  ORF Transcript_51969/g.97225 Transcript_51969/m.97225 type:complete len:93 (-) Transcript_51969:565-843(-)
MAMKRKPSTAMKTAMRKNMATAMPAIAAIRAVLITATIMITAMGAAVTQTAQIQVTAMNTATDRQPQRTALASHPSRTEHGGHSARNDSQKC